MTDAARCSACGQRLPEADRVAITCEALAVAARDAGMRVTGDGRIGEPDLEVLLCYAQRYLRQLREEGKAPPSYRLNGKLSYRLIDVALWIESRRLDY